MKAAQVFICLCLFSQTFFAQQSEQAWILGGKFNIDKNEGFKPWRGIVALDGRITDFDGQNVNLLGARAGLEYKRVHRFGFGLYVVADPLVKASVDNLDTGFRNAYYDFSYVSMFYERVVWFSKRWEFSSALHFGSGQVTSLTKTTTGFIDDNITTVNPLEVSTTGYFNPTWWLSLGGGIGYRHITQGPESLEESFNGRVYLVKLKVRAGKIVKSLWKPSVKNEY